ncbi:MAG: hypothetical protein ABSF80_12045 [Chitinispirillaceae bacterium]
MNRFRLYLVASITMGSARNGWLKSDFRAAGAKGAEFAKADF